MNKLSLAYLSLIILLTLTYPINAQIDSKIGVNELKYFYSDNYKVPYDIEFIFSGNPEYINYFYSDLEKKIREKFLKKKIQVSFRYLNKKKHFESENKNSEDEYLFYLHINNSTIINENAGSNRLMKFDFNGHLISKENKTITFSFKSLVYVIHDINSENDLIASYMIDKLLRK